MESSDEKNMRAPSRQRGQPREDPDARVRPPLICTCGSEGTFSCFHAETLELIHVIPTAATNHLRMLAVPPEESDDDFLVALSEYQAPGSVRLYNPYTKRFARKLQREDKTWALAYLSPSLVVAGDFSAHVSVSNVRTGKQILTLKDPPQSTWRIVCCNEPGKGERLVFVGGGSTHYDPKGLPIRLYDLKSERPDEAVRKFFGSSDGVAGLSYSSKDGLLVSGSVDDVLRVWSIRDEKAIARLTLGYASESIVHDSESHLVFCGSPDGCIEVYDVRNASSLKWVRKFQPLKSTPISEIVPCPTAGRDGVFASLSTKTIAKWNREGRVLGSAKTDASRDICFLDPHPETRFSMELREERMKYFLDTMVSSLLCDVGVGQAGEETRIRIRLPLSCLYVK